MGLCKKLSYIRHKNTAIRRLFPIGLNLLNTQKINRLSGFDDLFQRYKIFDKISDGTVAALFLAYEIRTLFYLFGGV